MMNVPNSLKTKAELIAEKAKTLSFVKDAWIVYDGYDLDKRTCEFVAHRGTIYLSTTLRQWFGLKERRFHIDIGLNKGPTFYCGFRDEYHGIDLDYTEPESIARIPPAVIEEIARFMQNLSAVVCLIS
jgi:hypothetical protein